MALYTGDPPQPSLGKRITHWRQSKGWRQVDLARSLSVSEASVSRWEAGLSTPSTRNVHRIAGVLDLSMTDFYGPLGEVA